MEKTHIAAAAVIVCVAAIAGTWLSWDAIHTIPQKRAFLTVNLKDPEATQFRNERLHKNGWLCGELNSKDGYGAYSGFRKFMVKGVNEAYLEKEGYAGSFEGLYATNARMDIEIMALELQNVRLQAISKMQSLGVATYLGPVSKAEAYERAVSQYFSQKWEVHCR